MNAINSNISNLYAYLALGIVIVGNAAGNLLLKLGATGYDSDQPFGMLNWRIGAGICCFGFAIIAYAWALRYLELHIAQIVVSIQYIAVILLAAFLLGEHISPEKWGGIGLIAIGLYLCLFK